MLSGLLLAILVVAGFFLAVASYSRSEMVEGSLLPAAGAYQISVPRVGRVEAVLVHEGQMVRKGAILARVDVDQRDRLGSATQETILSAMDEQRRALSTQAELVRNAASSEQEQFNAQITGLKQEIADINSQVSLQSRLVKIAARDFEQASEVARRGFISRRDIALREETLVTRQQQLSALRQSRAVRISALRQAERATQRATFEANRATTVLISSQAQVDRESAAARAEQGFVVVAPAHGVIAGMDLHVGDPVDPQQPIMTILARRVQLFARLYVPGRAVGFIRVGQPVQLLLESYPSERFGFVEGVITTLSSVPFARADRDGIKRPFYIASVLLKSQRMGRNQQHALLPGMELKARIITERTTLGHWLFDPLFAVTR